MFTKLFPYHLHLTILQLEGYQLQRFWKWILSHFLTRTIEKKKGITWTAKSKLILILSVLFSLLTIFLLTFYFEIIGFTISILLITQSYIFLSLATLTIQPFELVFIKFIQIKTKAKIKYLKSKGLKTIVISGSYGKTTTKEILYQLLRSKYQVLKTPENYNTLLGIAKVIDLELDESYDYFICEIGAYKIGDIKTICQILKPDHCILAAIGNQHLDRFGSQNNIIKAKFEIIQYTDPKGFRLINIDNFFIKTNFPNFIQNPIKYGQNSLDYSFQNYQLKNGQSSFSLNLKTPKLEFQNLNLSGLPYIYAILASATLSHLLGISQTQIQNTIQNLQPLPHKLNPKNITHQNTLIDDAYSSNESGFMSALEFLSSYSTYRKILVTPGIIDLGNFTTIIHRKLSQPIDSVCDHIYFIGKNSRTKALASQINKDKITYLDYINQFWPILNSGKVTHSAILLENDLPENY